MSKPVYSPKNNFDACLCAEMLYLCADTPDKVEKITKLRLVARSRLSRRKLKRIDQIVWIVKSFYVHNIDT